MGTTNTTIPTSDEINAMTPGEYKVLEVRLRRAAARQDLRLEKSRARDPRNHLWGTYHLVDIYTSGLVCYGSQNGYGLGLDVIAEYLFDVDREQRVT